MVRSTYNADVTGADGIFKTGAATPGSYTVQVGKIGYKPHTVSNVVVTAGEVTWLEVSLEHY